MQKSNPGFALLVYLMGILGFIWERNKSDEPEQIQAFFTALLVGLLISGISLVISELLKPKPDIENAKPSGRGDFRFPTVGEGRPKPLIWGRVRLEGPNVAWWGDFRQVPIKESVKTGLWSKKRVTVGFKYFVGMDLGFCRGGTYPVTMHNLFVGDKELTPFTPKIDAPSFLGGNDFGTGGIVSDTEFFSGTDTQPASTYLTDILAPGPVSAQRGMSHFVFEGGYIGNSTSIEKFSAELSRFPDRLQTEATALLVAGNYAVGDHKIGDNDLNPIEVIYEAIRDNDWGMNKTNNTVNVANFAEVAAVIKGEKNGFSFQLERVIPLSDLLDIVQEQIDGILYQDRLTGQYNIKLARQDYTTSIAVTSITGTNTYNVASHDMVDEQTIYAEGFEDPVNNGRKTVTTGGSATTVVVLETLADNGDTTTSSVFGGARISELNGINDSNKIEVREFSRQTWDGLVSQIRVKFSNRSNEFKETFARADSLGVNRSQGGQTEPATVSMPGIKTPALANQIAARKLRELSFPLAKATIITNRELWDTNPGQIIRWTNEELNIIDLVVRITRVDFGELGGNMTLGLIEDIFSLEVSFFGDPPDTLWTLPTQGVAVLELNEHQVFEAPKAIVDRDILFPGQPDRIFVGARARSGEVAIKIFQRNAAALPLTSIDYNLDGQNEGLFLIGSLNIALSVENANPTTTIQIAGGTSPFDSSTRMLDAMDVDGASAAEVGQQLANIIKIGDEFIGFESAAVDGGDANLINLTNCHRAMLDTVPGDHTTSSLVYLLFVSGGLNDSTIPTDEPLGNFVDVQPRTVSRDAELTEAQAKTFSFQMSNRVRKPYPPYRLDINTVRFAIAPSLDAVIGGSGDLTGLDIDWFRRNFTTLDEVFSMTNDAETLEPGFQALNNHLSQLTATVVDGDGLTLAAFAGAFITGFTDLISRAEFLAPLDGEIPSASTLSVLARHTLDAVTRDARVALSFGIAPTSAVLSGLANLGTVFATVSGTAGPVSRTYTTLTVNAHTLTVGSTTNQVEFRLNNGAWTAIASLPGTGIAVSDELEFRHHDASGPPSSTVAILDDGTNRAYVVLSMSTLLEGLAGYWNMNEVSTGVAQVDRASRFGGAPAMTDINTCASEAGAKGLTTFGNAVVCTDGTSDATVESVQIPNADALRKNLMPVGTEEFTIMVWMKFPVGGSTVKPTQMLWTMSDFDSGSPFTNRSCYLFFGGASDNFIFVVIENDGTVHSGTVKFSGGASGQEDKWIHCTMVVSSAAGGTLTVYIKDGTTTPSPSYSQQTGLGTIQTTTEPITLGAQRRSNADFTTNSVDNAAFDEFRIYKGRALSEAEVDTIVAATQPLT